MQLNTSSAPAGRICTTLKIYGWRTIAALLLMSANTFAQSYEQVTEIDVTVDGRLLKSPWSGGLNAPHFGEADLNHDGVNDLFVYDKDGKRRQSFIYSQGEYIYEPTYALNFPEINSWFLLADYNCDGVKDLITHGTMGAPQTYRGYYENDMLKFAFERPIIYYLSSSGFLLNLYTTSTHRPLLADINGDGDIDILAFDINLIRLDYYENQRVERGLSCDSLLFKRADRCWGNFRETGITLNVELGDTCEFKFNRQTAAGAGRTQHPGGSAIDLYDEDGDGTYDLLLGDATFERINYLRNNGSRDVANLYAQDDSFPGYDESVQIALFPAPYVIDIDKDGYEDILMAPFNPGAIENFRNVWLYENDGSGSNPFKLKQKDFLVGDMIDVGQLASPAFYDYNNDGKPDMLIGNGGYFEGNGEYLHSLTLFEHTGTPEIPAFRRVSMDFQNLSNLGFDDLSPFFGDIDNDGDQDLILGEKGGKLLQLENINGDFLHPQFIQSSEKLVIDVGQSSVPVLFDFDKNGTLDLIVGHRDGELVYYSNTGSASEPVFTFVTDTLGGVISHPSNSVLKYSSPAFGDFDSDGKTDLLLGGADSRLKFYSDIGADPNVVFELTDGNFLDEPYFNFTGNDVRPRLHPTAADLSNDGHAEIVVGISNGGLELFSQELADTNLLSVQDVIVSDLLSVYPNPTQDAVLLDLSAISQAGSPALITLTDALGRICKSETHTTSDNTPIRWELGDLPDGVYYLTYRQEHKIGTARIVKIRP